MGKSVSKHHSQDVFVSNTFWQQQDFLYSCMIKYHKAACKSLPDDEYLVVRNLSKTM